MQQKRARCLHQDLLGARVKGVGEDGGGGELIEVEGGVGGEGEAPSHHMEKVPQTYKIIKTRAVNFDYEYLVEIILNLILYGIMFICAILSSIHVCRPYTIIF